MPNKKSTTGLFFIDEEVRLKRIKEVIVVEGKTDTQVLKSLFDVDTIETHGSAIDDHVISLIKERGF